MCSCLCVVFLLIEWGTQSVQQQPREEQDDITQRCHWQSRCVWRDLIFAFGVSELEREKCQLYHIPVLRLKGKSAVAHSAW